ncbi:unnamed protein product [Rotaria sp. Silwood1]|nr:unnamed protein product [Rotaria sp. Silwood1]CAF1666774.1 unnamed protein product [Rotaria sp. Silwood1]
MQYKQESEKVGMINTFWMPVSKPISPAEDPEIQRTRKILLIILGVCLTFSIIGTINAISGNEIANRMQATQRGAQIGQSLISIIFYGFGIFVAYRYYETGLRVKISIKFILINNQSN